MDYKDIEESCKQDEELIKLLESYKPAFDQVDTFASFFQRKTPINKAEIQSTLDNLTGLYMSLIVPFKIIEAEKLHKEDTFYCTRKMEIEKDDGDFVSAAVNREASQAVATIRRVRNIFEAYVTACNSAIMTCQNRLKTFDKEGFI